MSEFARKMTSRTIRIFIILFSLLTKLQDQDPGVFVDSVQKAALSSEETIRPERAAIYELMKTLKAE